MQREVGSLYSFNRGVIDSLALGRLDVRRTAIAAAIQQNYIPRVMGSAMLRPGLGYIGATRNNHSSKFLPFVKNTVNAVDLLEFSSDGVLRIWQNDALVAYPALGSPTISITNNSQAGANATAASVDDFTSNGFAAAILDYTFTIPAGNVNQENAVQIVVGMVAPNAASARYVSPAPIVCRIGSTLSGDDYFQQTNLDAGVHVLALTPTSNTFYVRLQSTFLGHVQVRQVALYNATSTTLELATPYASSTDLRNLRIDQSADYVYVACAGHSPRVVQHRGPHSWSFVSYLPPDGPLQTINITGQTVAESAALPQSAPKPVAIRPSRVIARPGTAPGTQAAQGTTSSTAIDGSGGTVTITSSLPMFYPSGQGQEGNGTFGSVLSIMSQGQQVSQTVTAQNEFTGSVEISGVGTGRNFYAIVSGVSGTGSTVILQQSFGVNGVWVDSSTTFTTDTTATGTVVNDTLDNQIVYYRIGVKTGSYVSGTINVSIKFSGGSISGTVLLTNYISATQSQAEVIKPLGGSGPVTTWTGAQWSDMQGWPTAVALHEGRLWWAGQNGIFASVSDAFDSFDPTVVGDSGPIIRTIGAGPVDSVNWLMPLQRLVMGAQGSEWSLRSDALDDPVTPTSFILRNIGTQGSAAMQSAKVDQRGIFVNRTSMRVYMLEFGFQFYDYTEKDLTALCPRILKPGVVAMGVQRQPDTRIHFVRSDGTVVLQVWDPIEEVQAFVTVVTQGVVEDVVVLPAVSGNLDDQVYYVVNRTINGATVRYLEKWAQESECLGDQQLCKLADAHTAYSGTPISTITAPQLAGQTVVVWADGQDIGTNDSAIPWVQRYTADGSGNVSLGGLHSNIVVGLPYTAPGSQGDALFRSVKLGLATGIIQTPLNQRKRIGKVGLLMANVHTKGIQISNDGTNWDDMPAVEEGAVVTPGVNSTYDEPMIQFPGAWSTDQRVWLRSFAPRPCTLMALTTDLTMAP